MDSTAFVYRRMAVGAAILGLYGLGVAYGRLPRDLSAGTLVASWGWAMGLFACAGMVVAAGAATLACLGACAVRTRWRPTVAATLETALLVPIFIWLVLNEVAYSITSEVIGYETYLMIRANPAATFEATWEMGTRYVLAVAAVVLVVLVSAWLLSRWSFRSLWPSEPAAPAATAPVRQDPLQLSRSLAGTPESALTTRALTEPTPKAERKPCPWGSWAAAASRTGFLTHRRVAGSLTGGLLVLALLLGWQVHTRPSEALTTVCRSAPPLRALNLTRTLVGIGLDRPLDLSPGAPLITELEYEALMGVRKPPAPNVVLIVLESVPARALHCYGHPRSDVSPGLDALAAAGVLFEHCEATASFSSYGLVSILTSLHMLRAETNDHFVDTSFPYLSLPHALKLAGYQLALFSSGNEAFDNINRFYPRDEFDAYFSLDTADVPKPDCMRLDDHYAIERFEAWMADRIDRRPFYCSFYLQSTHFNYNVPEPWGSHYQPVPPLYSNGSGIIKIPPDVLPLLKNQYDNAMRFSDYWVGRIRTALERARVFDNTIVVVVGDHGEAFMEHGLARHGIALWEEMIHIPFILYAGPTVRARLERPLPSRIVGTVSGIDIAPTVAGLVGIRPHPSWQGVDLLAPDYTSQDRPVFSVLQLTRWQEALILNGFKYIYDLTDVQAQLFDLDSDPGEKTNLLDTHPDLASAMRDVLAAWHSRQLHYYAPDNRPFTHYLGRFDPDPILLERVRTAGAAARRK